MHNPISVPPFVRLKRLKKNIDECEKKNDVQKGNSEVSTPLTLQNWNQIYGFQSTFSPC
jgi:hypothetical protein